MPRISFFFFTTGALFVLIGVGLGIWMGVHENFTLAPVHAHINLIGWASMGLMGAFYAVAGEAAPRRLGWITWALMTAGLSVLAPCLGLLLLGDKTIAPILGVAESVVALAMLSFFIAVLITWARTSRTNGLTAAMPAQ